MPADHIEGAAKRNVLDVTSGTRTTRSDLLAEEVPLAIHGNGEPLAVKSRVYTLQLDKSGDYQVLVMDEAGQVATVNFTLQ